ADGITYDTCKLSHAPLIYHARMAKWLLESWRGENKKNVLPASNSDFHGSKTPSNNRAYQKGPDSHENPEFVQEWVDWPISWPSKWLVRRMDREDIRQRRLNNYRILHARLSCIECLTPCFPELVKGACPLGYPFIVESDRRVDYQLRNLGLPAFSFGEVLHESLPAGAFPEAEFLSKNLVILPIHQALSESDVDRIAEIVVSFFKKRISRAKPRLQVAPV
ncbi:MAG: hypothetical protein L0287_14360, partial [Anaerolineae bacterium]|nr:hypothetical protein [Anaerolineae bacterium]